VNRLQARDSLFGRLRAAAEKEHPVTLLRGAPYQLRYEISACDALRERVTKKPRGPDEGRAVAKDEVGIEENSAELDVLEGLHAEIDVGGDRIVRFARGDHVLDARDCPGDGEIIKGNAEERDREAGNGEGAALSLLASQIGWLGVFGDVAGYGDGLIGPHCSQ